MSHNGWSNYETWNVALWLGNERGSYDDMNDIIRRHPDDYKAGQALKGYVEEMAPDLGASMFSDLLNAALSEVDWAEIAQNNREEDEEEEESVSCRQTACSHCGQDIEGISPFQSGEWRDRGNSTHCPTPEGDAGQQHEPVNEEGAA